VRDAQSAAGRLEPERLVGLGGDPESPAGTDDPVEEGVDRLVEATRVQRSIAVELDPRDPAVGVQWRFAREERVVRTVDASAT
jgi:hypothetical protein